MLIEEGKSDTPGLSCNSRRSGESDFPKSDNANCFKFVTYIYFFLSFQTTKSLPPHCKRGG
jgi:hypothetical protein